MTVLLSGFNFLLCIFSSIDFYIHFQGGWPLLTILPLSEPC